MDSKQFHYTVGSDPEHDNLVLDIYTDYEHRLEVTHESSRLFEIDIYHKHLLEVTQEPGHSYEIDIYPSHEGNALKLDFEGFKEILERGMKRFKDFYIDSPQPLNHIHQQISYAIDSIAGCKNQALYIFVDNKQLLEISREVGQAFEISIYPRHDRKILKYPLQEGDFWKLDYLEFKKILDEGMKEFKQLF